MAGKITDLGSLGSTPAVGDLIEIVDVSDTTLAATGTNKQVTRANLVGGLAASGANSDITSLAGLSTPLSVPQGGSGAATLTGIVKGNGTSAMTAVTAPSGTIVGTTDSQTLTNKDISDSTNTYRAASTTVVGAAEIATSAEVNTGTDATRAVSPDGLAGSNYGIEYVQVAVFGTTTDTATGDGKAYFHIPAKLNGWNLVSVHAFVVSAGTTGTTDIQIANVTDAIDMLSTKLTIDSGETGSNTAATPAVINTTHDDVATNDVLRIDVDAVSTTAAKGLVVTLGFQLP